MSKNWICKECSEKIDKEFDTCWNCGYSIVDKNEYDQVNEYDKVLENKNKIEKQMYGNISDINNFENLHSYKTVLYIFIVINILSGLGTVGSGIELGAPVISLIGLLVILMGCYFLFKQIQIVDFLFFLNKKIDRLKKKN